MKKTVLQLQKSIPNIRLFERHVGQFFTHNNRPIQINRKGMADLYGLVAINGSMHHIEIEIKTGTGRQTKEQKTWQAFIEKFSGLYVVGWTVEDIEQEVKRYIKERG